MMNRNRQNYKRIWTIVFILISK